MKSLIRCNALTKKFGNQQLFNSFSIDFSENGLYAIYGDSGSGKTTFLNMINGLTTFESGEIIIFDKKFKKQVSSNYAKETIAYITQNCYFVDYLNIFDNLKLCVKQNFDNEKIDLLLKKMGLFDKKKKYPNQLSGGELQRLSLIIAILQNKKIIILDEPTASLDQNNTKLLISILQELKESHLIICATHDQLVISASDEAIDITENRTTFFKNDNFVKFNRSVAKTKFLLPYMLKRKYKHNKDNKSSLILVIVIIFVLMIINLCYDSTEKVQQSLFEYYNLNFVNYDCNIKQADHCEKILRDFGAIENMYLYANNIPMEISSKVELTAPTLPINKDLFPNVDELLLYGNYYEQENDLIVGYEYAEKITDNIEDLIGKNINVDMPDKMEMFHVVGIFRDVEENAYLRALTASPNSLNREIYLNDEYIKKYEYDGIPKMFEIQNGVVSMRAYFDSTDKLRNFYDSQNDELTIKKYDANFIDFGWVVQAFDYYLKPAMLVAFVTALLFFYEIENIQNKKRSHILSVYKYYGYSYIRIAIAYALSSLVFVSLMFSFAFLISVILTPLLNLILIKYNVSTFKLFIIDYLSAFKLYKYLILLSVVMVIPVILNQFRKGWLKTLKEGEDFI